MKKSTVRRLGLPVIVTIAAAAALTGLTAEVSARGAARPAEETAPREAGEPIMAIVSIKSQNVTFYDADGWILKAPVSTGVKGRETPAGVFAVLQKNIDHRSNLYDDAHMPHMQRLTWNGIAMHGGPLPGYAASHGCVRMPFGFASELFDKTRIGMRVIISPDDAPPVDFSHAALLVPNAEAVAAAPARAETLAREAAEAAKAVDETKKFAKTAARDADSAKATLRKAERQKSSAGADLASAEKALDKARSGEAKAQEQRLKAAGKATDAGAKLDIGKADTDATVEAAAKPADAAKAERQKSSADADLAAAEKALASAQSNVAKAEERRLKAAAKATEAAAKLDTIKAEATLKIDAAAKAADAAKAAVTRKAETAKAADEAKLALVPVSDLHQPRDAEALCAAEHAKAVAGRRRGLRCDHRGSGHDPRPREAHWHACIHGDGAGRRGPSLERDHDRPRGRGQERARPDHHPEGRPRSYRADRAAAIVDHRLGRAAEPRDQLPYRVRCCVEQSAAGRLHNAQAYASGLSLGRVPCKRQHMAARLLQFLGPAQP